MKQESTEQSSNASGVMRLMSDSTYKRVSAGPFTACIRKTQLRHDGAVRYSVSLEVNRTVHMGGTATNVSSFEFRPDDIRYLPMLIRNLAEFFVDDGHIDGELRWDLSNMASCLNQTFRFEEWEDDFFKDEDR